MIHEKWFISDTHFFHENMLKFVDDKGHRVRKQFTNIKEMHEFMIEQWNSVVGVNDYVYHLGDVTFDYAGPFNNLMSRLKGNKRLIIGNHDKIWNPSLQKWFEKAELWKGFHVVDVDNTKIGFTCSHMPLPLNSLRDGTFCVHGHTHERIMSDPHYINVCVETRNYKPVHLDTILAEIKVVLSDDKNRATIERKLK